MLLLEPDTPVPTSVHHRFFTWTACRMRASASPLLRTPPFFQTSILTSNAFRKHIEEKTRPQFPSRIWHANMLTIISCLLSLSAIAHAQKIEYLFTLYVPQRVAESIEPRIPTDTSSAATPTQRQDTTSPSSLSLLLATRSGILLIPAVRPTSSPPLTRASILEASAEKQSLKRLAARLSGGNIWLDYIVGTTLRNQTPTYNFATGANPVNFSRAQFGPTYTVVGPVRDFRDQQAQFELLNRSSRRPRWNSTNSLFINWFGINDVAVQLFQGRNYSTITSILGPDINDYFGLVDRQYSLGARRFLTILVPRKSVVTSRRVARVLISHATAIHRAPVFGYGNASNAADVQRAIAYWNNQMTSANGQYSSTRPQARARVFDPTSVFNQILDNPRNYGAPNSTCFSLPAGQPCLWRDFIHPGIVIHRRLGQALSSVVQGFV